MGEATCCLPWLELTPQHKAKAFKKMYPQWNRELGKYLPIYQEDKTKASLSQLGFLWESCSKVCPLFLLKVIIYTIPIVLESWCTELNVNIGVRIMMPWQAPSGRNHIFSLRHWRDLPSTRLNKIPTDKTPQRWAHNPTITRNNPPWRSIITQPRQQKYLSRVWENNK